MANCVTYPDLPPPTTAFRVSTIVFLIVLLIFLVLDLWMVQSYFLSGLLGGILAVLTRPLYDRLRGAKFGPTLASAAVVIGTIALVFAPMAWFIKLSVEQGISFSQHLIHGGGIHFEDLRNWLDRLSHLRIVHALIGNPQDIEAQLQTWLRAGAATASAFLLSAVGSVPSWFLNGALTLLTMFFLLKDGNRFIGWLDEKIPLDPEVRVRLYSSFTDTAVSTIWASFASALVQSSIIAVAFLVLGIPAAFLAAGATFISSWIPIIGSTPVSVIGVLYCIFGFQSVPKTIFMIGFAILTAVSDNFVRPAVLRGRGDMHPLVSLVAIFGGVSVFGFFGVFFGPILVAVFLALAKVWPPIAKRLGWMTETPHIPSGLRTEILREETRKKRSAK